MTVDKSTTVQQMSVKVHNGAYLYPPTDRTASLETVPATHNPIFAFVSSYPTQGLSIIFSIAPFGMAGLSFFHSPL